MRADGARSGEDTTGHIVTIYPDILIFFNPVILTCFAVDNYKVTVYTGIKYLAGTDARVFVELFGQNNGQSQNSGEVELAGKKDAFEMGR